jgi:glycine hydroxymethyltransferase
MSPYETDFSSLFPEEAQPAAPAEAPQPEEAQPETLPQAEAVAAEEAQKPEFVEYQKNVVENCAALADEFLKMGYKIVTGGTDNHVFLLDLKGYAFSGKELQARCDENGITLNKNAVPGDPRSPMQTSGVRIGTAPMTTRGFGPEDFRAVARRIDVIIKELAKEKEEEAKEEK